MLTSAQREARLTRVGASEVAALPLINDHPFTTAQAVYDRIVSGEGRAPTQNMMVGQLLEPAVLDLGRKLLGLTLRACSRPYVHPTLPLTASLDAYAGPGAIAEVKVTSAFANGLSSYVVWQVQTQLMLSKRELCHVIVLAGASISEYRVLADPEAQERILEAVYDFEQRHLKPRRRPAQAPFILGAVK